MTAVSSLIDYFADLWIHCPEEFPEFRNAYSKEDQNYRAQRFVELQEELNKRRLNKIQKEYLAGDAGSSIFPLLRKTLLEVFDFNAAQLNVILSDEFRNVSKDFFYGGRQFGPELRPKTFIRVCEMYGS